MSLAPELTRLSSDVVVGFRLAMSINFATTLLGRFNLQRGGYSIEGSFPKSAPNSRLYMTRMPCLLMVIKGFNLIIQYNRWIRFCLCLVLLSLSFQTRRPLCQP